MNPKYWLFQARTKQPFRVAKGKSAWKFYEEYNKDEEWNLREILDDELVIEFDTDNRFEALQGIKGTEINLNKLNITYEVWSHGGKSPHLHIRNIPFPRLAKKELRIMKKLLMKEIVPEKYWNCVDFSLCGIHLIAIEDTLHWKGIYGYKKLLYKYGQD